jgi:hypothetical protein
VHGPDPSPPTSLAAVQLPPVSSFAGDSGRPLKRRMLSKLQPLLEAAGANAKHVSGQGHAPTRLAACMRSLHCSMSWRLPLPLPSALLFYRSLCQRLLPLRPAAVAHLLMLLPPCCYLNCLPQTLSVSSGRGWVRRSAATCTASWTAPDGSRGARGTCSASPLATEAEACP